MRGKPPEGYRGKPVIGITPADAGKTPVPRGVYNNREDHPRGCGENAKSEQRQASVVGSPPRMRGKRLRACPTAAQDGITPAYAGKTAMFPTADSGE